MGRSLKILISFLLSLVLPTDIFAQNMRRYQESGLQKLIPTSNHIEFTVSYKFSVPLGNRRLEIVLALPQTIQNKQKIYNINLSPEPARIFEKNENKYAEYNFTNPDSKISIDITIEAEIYRYDLTAAIAKPRPANTSDYELKDFLRQEKYIEKDDPAIKKAAQNITGDTDIDTVKGIYNYVLDNMKYKIVSLKSLGAVTALLNGEGKCTEYADLFVTICRAKKIPARVVTGYAMGFYSSPIRHNWAEVYFKDYGWVPFELSGSDAPNMNIRNRFFSNLIQQYLYISNIRNDRTLMNGSFCVVKYWGDKVTFSDTTSYKRITNRSK
jgi:transglutaminase-like putative cysteine protease